MSSPTLTYLPSSLDLIVKCSRETGDTIYGSAVSGVYHALQDGETMSVLTWDGENFAWSQVTSVQPTLSFSMGSLIDIIVNGGRSSVFPQNAIAVASKIFEITGPSGLDGLETHWIPASRLKTGLQMRTSFMSRNFPYPASDFRVQQISRSPLKVKSSHRDSLIDSHRLTHARGGNVVTTIGVIVKNA